MIPRIFCKHGEYTNKCPLCYDTVRKETRIERLLRLEKEGEDNENTEDNED
jgi:hypothetical protein